ncbi:bifunctional lytic transglycosylase/C40 family peptidase [Prescottella sp. R16]|uniref:C40 family peptidase n=1 Tax=Prescottella sp. R16 TaxID=3064529 RepID=UPI00272ECCFC|nr:bifunctional lytic transglycosylase/C40 family peptidase [Prescottella sp. R16]
MSWERAAVVVAATAVVGVVFPSVAYAAPEQAPEAPQVPSAEPTPPQLIEPVSSLVALLPPEMRDRAATDLVKALPVLEAPAAPDAEAAPADAPAPAEAQPAEPAQTPVVPAPTVLSAPPAYAPTIDLPIVGQVQLPSLPAILPAGVPGGQVGSVAVFAPWLRKAGDICGGVTAPTLAALFSVENDFRYGPTAPVSLSGGRGPAKFMPSEWAKYGKDADGDGNADILGVADSVMAAGHMLCDNYAQMETWKQEGVVQGDTLDLALAAFNAGTRAVRKAGGVPSGIDDAAEQTGPYVEKIRASEGQFEQMLVAFENVEPGAPIPSAGIDIPIPTTGIGGAAVQLAMRFLGLPYVWGGGNINGPTMGGFDCSGLTSAAIFAATGGQTVLPRTSETQWHVGTEIPMAAAQPGDLVFGNWQAAGPGHVGIYMGNGLMVHAPQTGDVVKVGPVFSDMKARRILA